MVREYNLPDSFSAVLQRAMDGAPGEAHCLPAGRCSDLRAAGDGDTPEAGDSRGYSAASDLGQPEPGPGHDWLRGGGLGWAAHQADHHQPLSDLMPDIAMAGGGAGGSLSQLYI